MTPVLPSCDFRKNSFDLIFLENLKTVDELGRPNNISIFFSFFHFFDFFHDELGKKILFFLIN